MILHVLTADAAGKPLWMWLSFLVIVVGVLAFDLGILHRRTHEIAVRESLWLSGLYIGLGVAFGAGVWWSLGPDAGMAYLTGFVVEKTLALDNVFVIALIFSFFAVPRAFQHRVLFWGILGVIVLRAVIIGLGATLIAQVHWVLYLFAAFLVVTGLRMLLGRSHTPDIASNPLVRLLRRVLNVTDEHHGDRFFVRRNGTLFVTPLFVALLVIEAADIVFAVDSVPAIFSITTDPFVVYTSNIFAILGLRALYFALAAMIHRFVHLKTALAVVLVFIGSKIFLVDALGLEHFPAWASLGITVAILAAGIGASLWATRVPGREARAREGSTRDAPDA